jgi:hypothetical protein
MHPRPLIPHLYHTMSGQTRFSLAPILGNTRIGRQLSKTDRNRIYGALDAGARPSDVVTRLNLNFSASGSPSFDGPHGHLTAT